MKYLDVRWLHDNESDPAIPPLDEINSDPQFMGSEISEYEFNAMWVRAVTN